MRRLLRVIGLADGLRHGGELQILRIDLAADERAEGLNVADYVLADAHGGEMRFLHLIAVPAGFGAEQL